MQAELKSQVLKFSRPGRKGLKSEAKRWVFCNEYKEVRFL